MGELTGALITQTLDETHPVLGFTVGWIHALAQRIRALEVICLSRGPAVVPANVHVTVLPPGRFARTRRVRAVLKKMKRTGPLDFVLAHMCPVYVLAATWPTKLAPTFLWYAHSSVTHALRWANRRVDCVFSCSTTSYPLRSAKLVVVGHGIDTDRFVPPAARPAMPGLRMAAIGRITRSKYLDILVSAIERFSERNPDAPIECRLIGPTCGPDDEAYRDELLWMRDHKKLTDRIHVDPPVPHDQVPAVYQQVDVVANMTAHHSLDKGMLEAMACGCLVLTRNDTFTPVLGPHAELMVRDAASSGTVTGLIERLAALSPDERRRIGDELRAIVVREHGLNQMMDRIVDAVDAVTRRAR